MTKDELISLARDRLDLMQHERFEDVIPIQLQILDAISQTDRIHDLASAWNYLSMLYYRVGRYVDAEHASLESIAVYQSEPNPSDEAIACYEMLLSTILAAQNKFAEAVSYGSLAVKHYSTFHNPPDKFLLRIQKDVNMMIECRDRESPNTE